MKLLSTAEVQRRVWGALRHPSWRQRHPVQAILLLVLALSLVLGAACRPAAPPSFPVQPMTAVLYITRYYPTGPDYARWYRAMERCVMMRGNFAAIRWYTNPTPWTDGRDQRLTYGMAWRPSRILLNLPEAHDSALVSHEMVHDILAANRFTTHAAHPRPFFGDHGCSHEFHPEILP